MAPKVELQFLDTDCMRLFNLTRSLSNQPRSSKSFNVLILSLSEESPTVENLFGLSRGAGPSANEVLELVGMWRGLDGDEDKTPKSTKLRILEAPGLSGTSSNGNITSKILTTVASFYAEKYYRPDMILFIASSQDDRLTNATFVSLLQILKTQLVPSVIDSTSPNFIYLLINNSNPSEDSSEKQTKIKRATIQTLGIPSVTVTEIKYDKKQKNLAQQIEELQKSSDKLPANEKAHINLLLTLTKGLNDTPVKFTRKIHNFETPMNNVLMPEDSVSLYETFRKCWSEMKPREQKSSRMSPEELARKMERLGCKAVGDAPSTMRDTMVLFRKILPDSAMESMLREAGLEAPRIPVDFLLGSGYNITTDREATFNLLDLGSYTLSPMGCSLPKYVTANEHPEVRYICKIAQNKEDLRKERLIELGFSANVPLVAGLTYGHRSGYNLIKEGSMQRLSSVYETRLLMIECKSDAPLTSGFKKALDDLPKSYDKTNKENVQSWLTFFNQFGTHYVSRAYVGGTITFDVVTSNNIEETSRFSENDAGLSGVVSTIVGSTKGAVAAAASGSSGRKNNQANSHAAGGDSSLVKDLWNCESEDEFHKKLNRWEETIWENPIVSDMSITLGEITDLVFNLDKSVAVAMKQALKDLCRGQLGVEEDETVDSIGKPNGILGKKVSVQAGCPLL